MSRVYSNRFNSDCGGWHWVGCAARRWKIHLRHGAEPQNSQRLMLTVNLRSLRYVLKSRGGAALNVRLSVPQKTAAAPVSHAPEKISINTGREQPASENTHKSNKKLFFLWHICQHVHALTLFYALLWFFLIYGCDGDNSGISGVLHSQNTHWAARGCIGKMINVCRRK